MRQKMSKKQQVGAEGMAETPEERQADGAAAPAGEGGTGYLGFVAHEARNPLATALWCTELLGRISPEERAGARGLKLAGLAHRALKRLSRLLEDHFLSERLRAGGYPLRLEVVDLRAALAEAAGRALPGGSPALEAGAGMPLRADPGLLGRALESMLAAAGRGGTPVRAAARVEGGEVRLLVTGAPVARESLQRPRKGAPSDPSGRALGLVLAAEVARAHGASLRDGEGGLLLSWPLA
jgi:signal transduction histidine kinase